jgi:hypothetical protein
MPSTATATRARHFATTLLAGALFTLPQFASARTITLIDVPGANTTIPFVQPLLDCRICDQFGNAFQNHRLRRILSSNNAVWIFG